MLLGCPYAYAEYIGALLADALGYGYLDLRYSVPTPLDMDPADPEVTAARIRFVRTLTADGAGFTAAKRLGDGNSAILRSFDSTAEETLFIPRLQGG